MATKGGSFSSTSTSGTTGASHSGSSFSGGTSGATVTKQSGSSFSSTSTSGAGVTESVSNGTSFPATPTQGGASNDREEGSSFFSGATVDVEAIRGAAGEDGVSVVSSYITGAGHLIIILSDGTEVDAGPLAPGVKYTPITTTEYYIQESELIQGHNMFGVMTSGDTTVYLPNDVPPYKIIIVKNETNDYCVTTTTY